MQCPLCKTSNPPGSKFCNECGIRLPKTSEAKTEDLSGVAAIILESEKSDSRDDGIDPHEGDAQRTVRCSVADTAREMGFTYEGERPDANGFESCFEEDPPPCETPDADSPASAGPVPADPAGSADPVPDAAAEQAQQAPAASVWSPDKTAEMPALDAERGSGGFRAPETKRKRAVAPLVIGAIAAVAAIAAILFALYSFGVIGGPLVPDVVGLTQKAATNVLVEKGFQVETKQVTSDETEGTVLLSDPAANTHASEGSTVVLQVAVPRTVPDAVGKVLDSANSIFEENGITQLTIQKEKSDEPEGTILDVSPVAGTRIRSGTAVTVTVAEPYRVPSLVGLTQDAAAEALAAEGLNPVFASVYDSTAAEGTVVSSEPAADTAVKSGTDVTVAVAKDRGKELTSLAAGILGGEMVINGTAYQVDSVNSVSYAGNDCVSFSVTARAFTYLDGEKVYGSPKSVSGTMQFDASNNYSIY